MKKLIVFRALIAALFVLLPFLEVSPVQADQPIRFDDPFDITFDVENPCGFPITGHFYGKMKNQFFLKDGQLTHGQALWGPLKAKWSANGKELDLQISGPIHFQFYEGGYIETITGTGEFITIPGYGPVYGGAGHVISRWQCVGDGYSSCELVEEIKRVGYSGPIDWVPICAYLAE